ncbi:MAG TPA: hypothetical protein VFZ22_06420 [Pyrinomonadaceae bacterium]|nr:hypothetical protein [Pyrinomonadaceae bacterium]
MSHVKCLSLSIIALLAWQQVSAQKSEMKAVWLNRAHQVTNELISDVPRLSKPERALTLARLADVWWRDDQERARTWYKRAVDLVEPIAGESASETRCRLAIARTVLSILSRRDLELNKRLLSLISDTRHNQDPKDRSENADALVSAALAIVTADPNTAEALAESALKLAASIRMGQLLWRLHSASPAAGDKLFLKIEEVALQTSDVNLFSLLLAAVTRGPFTASRYKTKVLAAVSELLARIRQPAEVPPCDIILLVSPLFASTETLLPTHAQRLQEAYALCSKSIKPADSLGSDEKLKGGTIDELLKAADRAENSAERTRYLTRAVEIAAEAKDFDKAISILDSMPDESRKILGDSWSSWRWDYAASAACASRKFDNLQGTQRVIDDTPSSLRAPVRIALVLNCDSFTSSEVIQFLSAARSELQKTQASEQFRWSLSLVRLYGKHVPESAPAVLLEAVNYLNRGSKDTSDFCGSPVNRPTILTSQLLLNQYKLPASLWDLDEAGMLNAVGLVERSEEKAALRLNLITVALTEQRKLQVSNTKSGLEE